MLIKQLLVQTRCAQRGGAAETSSMNFCAAVGILFVLGLTCSGIPPAFASEQFLDPTLHHIRISSQREWSDFPEVPEGPRLVVRFQAQRNAGECTLRLRQQDIKQTWKVLLNAKDLGRLVSDENDQVICLPIPSGRLVAGENTLAIEQIGTVPDDIRVGEIVLYDQPVQAVLSEAKLDIRVVNEQKAAVPCRITVLDDRGALMTVGATSSDHFAFRPGVIYSGTGEARFGLPPGQYTIIAGRGPTYSIDSAHVSLRSGDVVRKQLSIRREVPTTGYVSCDTHVHTLTYSGHGDCTLDERMLTIAGEGLELPIATDHNKQINYDAAAVKMGVRRQFTPVVGNEVTTAVGHFNIFPVSPDASVPNFQLKDWKAIFDSIAGRTQARVIVLNHARDLHSGFRPFGPEHHNAVTAENLDGWALRANALEVINSGAQQSDVMRLYRDWFALLNRGLMLTPVGASDSHDVSRFIVGQARTYIRCKREQPGAIDVNEAVKNLLEGRVLVSLGLLTEMTVNDRYSPGDLVPASEEMKVTVRVFGPSWAMADKVELYVNGRKIREERIADSQKPGVKWSGEWKLPRLAHDVHLVAVASGPGVRDLYWPIAKPYQPTSPHVDRRVIGSTGAIWIDSDGDGKRTCALEYANRLLKAVGAEPIKAVQALEHYDEAVAAQLAGLLQARGVSLQEAGLRGALQKAGEHAVQGFQSFEEAWRESAIARKQ